MTLAAWVRATLRCGLLMSIVCGIAHAGEVGPLGMATIDVSFGGDDGSERLTGVVKLQLTCTDPLAFTSRFVTSASGHAEFKAPPGTCVLESAAPVRVHGKLYSWRGTVKLSGGKTVSYAFTSKDALLQEGDSLPPRTIEPAPDSSVAAGGVEPAVATGDMVLPVLFFAVEPNYPDIARRARIEGKVILQAVIEKSGDVSDVNVVSSSNPMFNDPAVAAVKARKYVPALRSGEPVRIYFTIRTDFRVR